MTIGFRLAASLLLFNAFGTSASKSKPNILFILTDDQDWHMESMQHMPFLQKYLINEGTVYSNHYCTVALCCPSRANLWTGKAAHNTNVTDVYPPYGGYPKFVAQGWNDNYLPVWMQQQGYNTYYTGKLWNGHTIENYATPMAGGFNGSDFILDPYTYSYYNAFMSRNGAAPVSYEGQYSPDVTAEKAYGFLDEAMEYPDRPWFLTVAPIAPHGDMSQVVGEFKPDVPGYAPRHAHLFKDYKIPRTRNFNPETPSGVGWMRGLPRLNETVIEYNDEYQRARLRALQSVDEMVEQLVKTLEARGQLDNTYIFYTTDNGYHISSRRMLPGKECSYEEDIHIPLIIRGPNVPAGHVTKAVTSHTDLAPTILELAGGQKDDFFDGAAIPLEDSELRAGPGSAEQARTEHINVEYWGLAIPEGKYNLDLPYGKGQVRDLNLTNAGENNTYKSLRVISDEYNLFYSVWCTGDKEYYDLKADPDQLDNYLGDDAASFLAPGYNVLGRPLERVLDRLDALMMVLKSCSAQSCRAPWKALHPDGDVGSLAGALHDRFDEFYADQPKVQFEACARGYIPELEGPMNVKSWGSDDGDQDIGESRFSDHLELRKRGGSDNTFEYSGHWSLWT